MPEEGDAEPAVEAVDGGDPPQQLGADADGHGRPAQRRHRRVRDAEARQLRRHHGHVQAVRQLQGCNSIDTFFGPGPVMFGVFSMSTLGSALVLNLAQNMAQFQAQFCIQNSKCLLN